jgi:hypothetical protein
MDKTTQTTSGARNEEPRWIAAVAFLAVGGLYTALPGSLVIIPNGVLLSLILLLLILTNVTRWMERHHANQILGYITNGIVTAALISSVALLVRALPLHKVTPVELLRSSAALWVTNILVFALWYWRLDAGGPHRRDQRPGHREGAFMFPQMGMDDETQAATNQTAWSPQFVDYLFLGWWLIRRWHDSLIPSWLQSRSYVSIVKARTSSATDSHLTANSATSVGTVAAEAVIIPQAMPTLTKSVSRYYVSLR